MTVLIKEGDKVVDRTIETLHDAVVAHYTKIGLYDHATALKQKCYALGEAGETTDAVLKGDIEEIKDGIGDVLVCVINWCEIKGVNFMLAYENAEPVLPKVSSDSLCVYIHSALSVMGDNGSLYILLEYLEKLADNYSLTLADCLGHSYDIVSKRRVKPLNGVIVKESDWHKYPELEGVEPL